MVQYLIMATYKTFRILGMVTFLLNINVTYSDDDLQSKINFEFNKECYSALREGAQRVGVSKEISSYNTKCDHEFAYQQGLSLNYVYLQYMKKIKDEFSKADDGRLEEFKNSGLCLETENMDSCKSRFMRDYLAAEIEVRNTTLKYNNTRSKIATQNRNTLLSGDDSKAASSKDKKSILHDFYRASQNQKKIKQVNYQIGPKDINYSGDLEKLDNAKFMKTKAESFTDPKAIKALGLSNDKNHALTVEDESENEVLKAKLQKLLKKKKSGKYSFSSDEYKKDEKEIRDLLAKKSKEKKKITINGDLAIKAFESTMDDINNSDIEGENKSSKNRKPGSVLTTPREEGLIAVPDVENNLDPTLNRRMDNGLNPNIQDMLNDNANPISK